MDCEKFEAAMMDELYGELDELTSAAAKRHLSSCSRCVAIFGGLRATRRLAVIPVVDPPAGLQDRIVTAAREIGHVVPLRRRVARAVSLAGNWAMRPQTAMAAVFLVMIGTSALLLTGKASRAPVSASVTVTEDGRPASGPMGTLTSMASAAPPSPAQPMQEAIPAGSAGVAFRSDLPRDESALSRAAPRAVAATAPPPAKDDHADMSLSPPQAQAPSPSPTTASPSQGAGFVGGNSGTTGGESERAAADKKGGAPFTAAVQSYQAGRYEEATKAFDALAPADPTADLWAARSVREAKGCRAALARFDRVAQRGANSPPGWDALLEGALCYRAIGDVNNARTRLGALLGVDSHKDRARAELDRLSQMPGGRGGAGPAAAAKAPAAAPAPPPARPPASSVDQAY